MKFELQFEDAATGSGRPMGSTSAGVPTEAAQPPVHPRYADGRTLRRTARLRGWKLPITDGPFAESKEL